MDDPFPTVGENTDINVIRKLIKDFQALKMVKRER